MVGYIDDSSISNKFRVRFESGSDVKGADRAEFFYAKCGCYRDLPPTNAAYDPDAPGPGPGVLTSADYTEAFQEVQALGGNGTTTPSTRTPEQTEIALFWAGVGVTNAAVAIWNQIAETVAAEHNLTLIENARLFALMNVTIADSYIAGFDAKYTFNDGHGFWRPVTAIRAANTDGNEDTVNDPTWTPLIVTVNHP